MNNIQNSQKKSPIKLIIVSIIIGLFAGVFYLSLSSNEPAHQGKERKIPAFSMPLLYEEDGYLTSKDFDDKELLVSIWASWCVPCRNEHKVLMELSKEYGITVFGIDYKDSRENGLAFLSENGNPFTKVGLDEAGTLALEWGIAGVPETFVVKDKKILFKHQGELTKEHLPEFLEKLKENGFKINKN